MKKMIMIAALIGGMLMPAEMMANNEIDRKPRFENRGRKEIRVSRDKKGGNKGSYRNDRADYRPGKPGKPMKPGYRPGRPDPVIVVNPPAPRPCPPPPPPAPRYYYDYDNPVVEATTAFLGIAALISLIAD